MTHARLYEHASEQSIWRRRREHVAVESVFLQLDKQRTLQSHLLCLSICHIPDRSRCPSTASISELAILEEPAKYGMIWSLTSFCENGFARFGLAVLHEPYLIQETGHTAVAAEVIWQTARSWDFMRSEVCTSKTNGLLFVGGIVPALPRLSST